LSWTEGLDSTPLFAPGIRQEISDEIEKAGDNEVFFLGRIDDQGLLDETLVVARGSSTAVPVFLSRAEEGFQVLIHNHPGGDLTPSPADLSIAAEAGARRLGFFIVSNDGGRVNRVVEPFPEQEESPVEEKEIEDIFCSGGVFSSSIPDFEERPGQVEMSKSVARALNDGDVAALEAGTGVGKSYAYLVPAILWAVKNHSRVVVSTATIPLGEQLVHRDLPTLHRVLGIDFRYALIQGRGNYACRRKTQQVASEPEIFAEGEERRGLGKRCRGRFLTRSGPTSSLHPINLSRRVARITAPVSITRRVASRLVPMWWWSTIIFSLLISNCVVLPGISIATW